MKQISVFIENKPGKLAKITDIIAKNNINIRALSIADTENFGILRIIVDDPAGAEKVLKENAMTVSITSVVAVAIDDRPGGLAKVLKMLAEVGIDIEYMYAFVSKKAADSAYVIMRIEQADKATEMLKEAGYADLNIEL